MLSRQAELQSSMDETGKEDKLSENLEGGEQEPDGLSDGEGESVQHPKDFPSSDDGRNHAVEKANPQSGDSDASSSPEKPHVQGFAMEKAPPPVKIRRETGSSHATSPPELSPPPSPKRMRELERKEGVFRAILPPSKELQQNL